MGGTGENDLPQLSTPVSSFRRVTTVFEDFLFPLDVKFTIHVAEVCMEHAVAIHQLTGNGVNEMRTGLQVTPQLWQYEDHLFSSLPTCGKAVQDCEQIGSSKLESKSPMWTPVWTRISATGSKLTPA